MLFSEDIHIIKPVSRGGGQYVPIVRSFGAKTVMGAHNIQSQLPKHQAKLLPVNWRNFVALACETPVISTSLGAEGLGLVSGRDILIADDAYSFSKEIRSYSATDLR